jgi:anhydro-N-acetylmuramic acid kinase
MSAAMSAELYIGLMSGTSLDGIDAVLASFPGPNNRTMEVLAHQFIPFPEPLRGELLALNSPGPDEAHRCALAANAMARSYADTVQRLLAHSGHAAAQIRALGAHGQTIRHRPGEFDGVGYTLQLLNGALLAELSGIPVVCDLRSRDVAAGGQGAPLVPAFHASLFSRAKQHVAVLNVGGISNISLLGPDGQIAGFDCGPGNCLMDAWIHQHHGRAYDAGGDWAASGRVLPDLLTAMLDEPYFCQAPPRSTGRDLFNAEWLSLHRLAHSSGAAARDVQATLLELTARCISDSIRDYGPAQGDLLVCGGGALNLQLMRRLKALLPAFSVQGTDSQGLPAMQVEAAAFAWLAQRHCAHLSGNLPAVTGAAGPRILGAYHPA